MRRFLLLLGGAALAAVFATACRSDVTMWSACRLDGEQVGTDGTYVLVVRDGMWQPVMTVDEFARVRRGRSVTPAPLPTVPAGAPLACPTVTTTTTSATTTTAAVTTTAVTSTTAPAPAPTITSLSPDSGPETGGQTIQIAGTHLSDVLAVTFGGIDALDFVVVDDSHLMAVTPPVPEGIVDVVVTSPAGSSPVTSASQFLAAGGA